MKNSNSFRLIIVLVGLIYVMISCKKQDHNDSSDTNGKILDIDGNLYDTVRLGLQTWMVQNLKVTHFSNGDPLLYATTYINDNAYCNYLDDEKKANIYGRLYNWSAVTDNRNICPFGWHVPTFEDWEELRDFLGGESIAGRALKEEGTNHWLSPNDATNSTGFTALPGGMHDEDSFESLGYGCFIWSSTWEYLPHNPGPIFSYIFAYYPSLEWGKGNNYYYLSIRCIKNR